ncbi:MULTISPECIES: DUF2897 family protein [Pseudoalteromonas]|uniref:DUF2897 family protein n=1 Tax=Pseudoalteromonas TaxID=53246 RepID=UPI00029A0156|nr:MULTISPECIES: DUF2897 family protein [Pseudoalteromonas]MBR8842807.1 DUF2897 family protein [Pseudoalteromonas sp. JC3]MCF2827566.1 DUF2897 family protein [Pseudoalteromonas sp. OF5H-5]MCF2830120.1 DUF2897 family protein [Pseudoalteromonas sp. DL2-H6]MCF2927213.1 DUF2897 family protein [Pseudoalteromonas sp. DL2-H1]MCF7516019.1 DUF2897 family protein [Pseudoalteromonas sp. L7]
MGNQLETWQVVLIIAGVLGVIWSNIALLKYSAKFEMKKKIDEQTAPFDKDKVTSKNNTPQNNPKKDED